MFDARLRLLIDPPLNRLGRSLAAMGITANMVTLLGILIALLSAAAIAHGYMALGLALILANRLADGVDGAVARATKLTDFGGYLDIVGDFIFYVAVPVGFALASPVNQLPAAILLASFALTGASFLAYAAIAANRGEETGAHGRKSFFYSTGIAEGGETILAFIAMCLLPAHFPLIAGIFAVLCGMTVIQRTMLARSQFSGRN